MRTLPSYPNYSSQSPNLKILEFLVFKAETIEVPFVAPTQECTLAQRNFDLGHEHQSTDFLYIQPFVLVGLEIVMNELQKN